MLENRSFDHILGSFTQIKKIDGAPTNSPFTNDYLSKSYAQTQNAARVVSPDPKHDLTDVLVQLETDAKGNAMSGFVKNYGQAYPQLPASQFGQVMDYYALDSLPALHQLARQFSVCDHWFSSVPGPTWSNRLFAMTGTSLGRVTMPEGVMDLNLHWYDQPTVFDRLNERGISWKVYSGDIPVSLILVHQWEPQNAVRHRPMIEFYLDAAKTSDKFPDFVWIEPTYLPPRADDYHPPHDVFDGEELVASVYNALRANKEIWNSSLLIVLFDEHGGFCDHISPPLTTPPDHHQEEYTFDRLGVRVPAILISPWIGNGVISEVFDHTSLLRYLTDKWSLGPLGQRVANAKSFANFMSSECRTDTPESLNTPPVKASVELAPLQALTEHERAMVALSHALESMAEEDPNIVAARSRQVLSGPQSQIDAAVDRLEGFLSHQATKLNSSHTIR